MPLTQYQLMYILTHDRSNIKANLKNKITYNKNGSGVDLEPFLYLVLFNLVFHSFQVKEPERRVTLSSETVRIPPSV